MKRIYYVWLFLFIAFSIGSLNAQADLTGRLVNPGFDEQFNYTKDAEVVNIPTATDGSTSYQVYGWQRSFGGWACSASFEYGYGGTLNHADVGAGTVPAVGYNGSTGGALGLAAAWTGNVEYTQDIVLPAGNYTMEYASYNSGPAEANTSISGWVPFSGDTIFSDKASFAISEWEVDVVNIASTSSSPGKIQVGISAPNSGSGAVGRIFIDYVKLVCLDIDKTELNSRLTESAALIEELAGAPIAVQLTTAKSLLEAQMGNEATDPALINAGMDFLTPFFKAQYSRDLLPLIDEGYEALDQIGGSPSTKAILESLIVKISNEYDNGEIGITEFPKYLQDLRSAIDTYLASIEKGLRVHYDFNNVTDKVVEDVTGSGYNGTLMNEANVLSMGKYKVLSTGNGTGYLDMGTDVGKVVASMEDFTVSAYYRVDENASLSGDGYFLWAFSSSNATNQTQGEYIAYRLNAQLYEMSPTGWGSARNFRVQKGGENAGAATKGEWQHILYRQVGRTGELWLNGEMVGSLDTMFLTNEVVTAPTSFNSLAKAPFSADNYLKNTLIYDFRLYNEAVENSEIAAFAALVPDLNKEYAEGGGGDFTQLLAAISESRDFSSGMTVGDAYGQYPQIAKDSIDKVIVESQTMVDEGKATQLLIDPQVQKMQNVLKYARGSINAVMVYPEGNTPAPMFAFESGLYYIQVGDKFVTMPTNGGYNTPLQLQEYIGNTDQVANNQVFKVEYNPTWSILEDDGTGTTDIRALFSIVSSTGVWTPSEDVAEETYWHVDEYGLMKQGGTAIAQSADGANWTWREHMLYYAGQNDASGNKLYSIVNHNQKASIYFKEATAGSNTTYTKDYKVYQFRFRTVEDVVNELGTSITVDQTSDVKVYGSQGEIVVTGATAGDAIQVYDFSGREIQSQKATGADSNIAVPAGFYIVKVADTVSKVIVR